MQASDSEQESITGINVTPLVDVILVLLIIFMATAPLLHRRALNINIPKAKNSERIATETVQIEFGEDRKVVLGERKMTIPELFSELSGMVQRDPAVHVALAADQSIPYGEIVGLLDEVRRAGVKRVGLEVKNK